MKKLLSVLLCLGLCCGCNNTTTTSNDESEDVDTQEDVVEEVESLLPEDKEDIQSLLLCMNYGDEDNAYMVNFFNRSFNEDYFKTYDDGEPDDLDYAFMVFEDEIGYGVCKYYLESIANIDIEEDLEKSSFDVDEYTIGSSTTTLIIVDKDESSTEYSFTDYLVTESDLGEDYYNVTYTLSDGTNTYDDCQATIYANARSWFGYTIYEFEQGDNQESFELFESDFGGSSQTGITSISDEDEAVEYIEAILNVPGQTYSADHVLTETSEIFGDYYYIMGSWNDLEAILPETGMIIDFDGVNSTYEYQGERTSYDLIMISEY